VFAVTGARDDGGPEGPRYDAKELGELGALGGYTGTARSGIGFAVNNRRHGFAIHRAQFADRPTRALSVAMPVLAYICRYSFEMSTNASRDFNDLTHCARVQMFPKL
jgi:hypothetical protein